MRGEEPVIVCRFNEEGEELRELILVAFHQFVDGEAERERAAEGRRSQ